MVGVIVDDTSESLLAVKHLSLACKMAGIDEVELIYYRKEDVIGMIKKILEEEGIKYKLIEITSHLDAPNATKHLSIVFVPQHLGNIINELRDAEIPIEILKEHKYPSVKEVASEDILFVSTTTSVQEIAILMLQRGIDFAVVREMDKPVGFITFGDLIRKVVARGRDPKVVVAEEIMSTPLRVIDSSSTIQEAARIMMKYNIKKLPVVEDNRVVGILKEEDLLKVPLRLAKFYKL